MTKEQSFFISMLRDYIIGRKTCVRGDVDMNDISLIAQAHQLAPIIYYQTKQKSLYNYYLQAVSIYTQRKTIMSQIGTSLGRIPFYIVKGLSISQYYPVPQLRTMGDCDIVVHESDKETVRQILHSIGFSEYTDGWDSAEWHFKKQGMEFELHHSLLYDENVITEEEKKFAALAWENVHGHELDVNFHFVFVLIHLKKHMLNSGVGFRQFMDLAVLSKNVQLDIPKVSLMIETVGLTKFASVCSALCLRWFGVVLPILPSEISDAFYNHATEVIFANGVFGFEDSSNRDKGLLNAISASGKLSLMLSHLFPSYKICCLTKKYCWIIGKPYLLPALWIYRIVWAIFKRKGKSSIEYLFNISKTDKALAERNEELSDWGL